MSDDIDETRPYGVVYEKVLKGKEHLAVTKLLAASLIAEPYTTVQNFLIGLTDNDLQTLVELADKEDDPQFGDLVLIAGMLAEAEGLDQGNFMVFQERTSALIGFLIIESLSRKGLVKAYRENMSFGEDMGHKIIVEKL